MQLVNASARMMSDSKGEVAGSDKDTHVKTAGLWSYRETCLSWNQLKLSISSSPDTVYEESWRHVFFCEIRLSVNMKHQRLLSIWRTSAAPDSHHCHVIITIKTIIFMSMVITETTSVLQIAPWWYAACCFIQMPAIVLHWCLLTSLVG